MPPSFAAGRDAAWHAVADPKPGTMLTLFDALVQATENWPARIFKHDVDGIVDHLDGAVRSTMELLPELKRAGVVDAGALGMFIFFEGFFCRLESETADMMPVTERFAGLLDVAGDIKGGQFPGYCVNTIIRAADSARLAPGTAGLGGKRGGRCGRTSSPASPPHPQSAGNPVADRDPRRNCRLAGGTHGPPWRHFVFQG